MRGVASLALLATLAGCGYRPLMHGEISGLPATVRTIAIGTLKNRTLRPAIHPALKDELIRRFTADARIKVADEAAADTVLDGAIETYGEDPLAFDKGTDTARRVRISISFAFTVTDRLKETVLLREGVSGVAYALFAPGVAATRVAEDEAAGRAIADVADRVVNRVLDGI